MTVRVERLLNEVREYCKQARGRQVQLANYLKIPRQRLSEWLKADPDKHPTAEQALAMQEFLAQKRRERRE